MAKAGSPDAICTCTPTSGTSMPRRPLPLKFNANPKGQDEITGSVGQM